MLTYPQKKQFIILISNLSPLYKVFQKELYNFESL
jgi:hypothetical protein